MTVRSYFRLLDGRGEVPALDGQRGVAIVLVVLYHCVDSFVPKDAALIPVGPFDLATPILSGWMGVNLFFVLSGFLITHHLLRRWHEAPVTRDLKQFLLKRFLRIVPTYYVVLAIAAAGVVPHYVIDDHLLGLQVAWHLVFLQDYLPSSILGPFWSLGVEEKFYLAMPIVLIVAWRMPALKHRLGFLALVALIPLLIRIGNAAAAGGLTEDSLLRDWRNPFHLNLDALFLGAIAAWIRIERHRFPVLADPGLARRAMGFGTALILALSLVPVVLRDGHFFYFVALFPLTAFGMGLILFGAALQPRGSSRLLESAWLARAGRIAYPWYLTHILVLHYLWGELGERAPGIRELSPLGQLAIFLPVFLAASIIAALALHFLVEKPCLLLKDSIGRPRRRATEASYTAQTA